VFLDVEDLLDISRLEEYVKASDVLVCFLSGSVDLNAPEQRSDYFRPASCLRELRPGPAGEKADDLRARNRHPPRRRATRGSPARLSEGAPRASTHTPSLSSLPSALLLF